VKINKPHFSDQQTIKTLLPNPFGLLTALLFAMFLNACAPTSDLQPSAVPPPVVDPLTIANRALNEHTDRMLDGLTYTLQEETAAETVTVNKTAPDSVLITISGDDAFRTGHARLNRTILSVLDKLTETLLNEPQNVIYIVSHTDNTGSEEVNQKLSERRASAVAGHMERKGLTSARISSVGRGEAEPITSNDDKQGQAMNRRLEIFVLADL